jgi:hypothetical protein
VASVTPTCTLSSICNRTINGSRWPLTAWRRREHYCARGSPANSWRFPAGTPSFRFPPLAAEDAEQLADDIERIEDNTAERAKKIEKKLQKALNRRISLTEQWLDPYIGLRGRYNFSEKCYFLARADVSPFDVGADFAWQASAGFGCQLTQRIYGELVYRILDVDYRHDGFIYDNTTYGPEITLGMNF